MITKVSLDAVTDQVLAEASNQRRHGEPVVRKLAELGEAYAEQLSVQFPGQDEAAGRVLASAATMASRALDDGALPNADALLLVLGFAAEALTRRAGS